MPHRIGEQDLAVLGVQIVHDDEQGGRQGQQDDTGQAAFAGQCLNLSPDLESFANQRTDLVQDFRQVTARLPLQDDGGDKEAEVQVRHAPAHVFQSIFERHAQVLGFVASLKLLADRIRHLIGDQIDAAGQAVAGSQSAADQFQSFGHLGSEFPESCRFLSTTHISGRMPRIGATTGAQVVGDLGQDDADRCSEAGQAGREQDELGRIERHVRLFQQPPQVADARQRSFQQPLVSSSGEASKLGSFSAGLRPAAVLLPANTSSRSSISL